MKTLFCIIHTQHQSDRYYNINNSWGNSIDYIFYSDHEDVSQKTYKVSKRSDYYSGQEKQIYIFRLLSERFNNYDWYIFCDNDTFINVNLLHYHIRQNKFDTDKVHGSIINYWPQDTTLYYPSGGAGFIMSKYIVHKLFNNDLMIHDNLPFGDVALGLNCRRLGIQFQNNDLFRSQSPEFYNISDNDVHKYISFHYITQANRMIELHKLCDQK